MFIGKKRTLLVNDPIGLKYVLLDNGRNYPKNTPGYKLVADVIGQGVFTDVGEEWKKGRKTIQPTFNPSKFDHYFSIVSDESQKTIVAMKNLNTETLNFSSWSTRYALHVIGRSLFNETLEDSFDIISKSLSHLIDLTEVKMTSITQFKTPARKKLDRDFNQTLDCLDREIEKIINAEKLKERKPRENMIHALFESPENFSDKKILSQVKTMVFAGHETTANVLSWAFYFLSIHPEWQIKIYQEYSENNFTLEREEDLVKFINLKMFLSEVLRMRPPAWSFGRVALERDMIHGEQVNPGDLISISPYFIHHHPDFWDNPENFHPERFRNPPKPFTFIPYGAGQRICMGERLANLEMCLFILNVVKTFTLSLSKKSGVVSINAQVSLRSENEIYIDVKTRPE